MIKIPITFTLMTTTKGHFGVKTRYLETLNSFGAALPFSQYEGLLAHIKESPGEVSITAEMMSHIQEKGFKVKVSEGVWSHGDQTHQSQYLNDLMIVSDLVKTPYVLIAEDDWLLKIDDGQFIDYLQRGISWMEEDPFLVQVRIPRWANEQDRICNLLKKHGLNRWAHSVDQYHFRHDDFSANPSIYRTRDLRTAIMLTLKTNLPKHVEHGLGDALKFVSGCAAVQFACFNPSKIHICHVGAPLGSEDPINTPLIAT